MVSASDSQSDGPRVRVPLWPLAGFVLGRPKLKYSAMLVNSQLVVSYQLGSLNCYVAFDLYVSKHFSNTQLGSHYPNTCLCLFQCCFVIVFRWNCSSSRPTLRGKEKGGRAKHVNVIPSIDPSSNVIDCSCIS